MDEHPVNSPGVPAEVYHKLGAKTLWIFVLARLHTAMIVLLVALGLLVVKDHPILRDVPRVGDVRPYMQTLTWAAFLVFIVAFLIAFAIAWLIYFHYRFSLGEHALKIKQGIIMKKETAIPYRQIQNVNIERDLAYQAFGLSRIVILTAGEDEEENGDDDSEGVLPGLDRDLAEWLQAELLRRANVQKVVTEKA